MKAIFEEVLANFCSREVHFASLHLLISRCTPYSRVIHRIRRRCANLRQVF